MASRDAEAVGIGHVHRMMPTTLRAILLVAAALTAGSCAHSRKAQFIEREDFGRHFQEERADGSFVLFDPASERFLVYDSRRARKRAVPASTFKIVNSLIALETGSIADTSTVLAWDGRVHEIASWNHDHSMTTAFRNSVVWYYQEAAHRIGESRMREFVRRIDYGNNDIGGSIDRFWLDGKLRISPLEQVNLLVRLYNDKLPFSTRTLDAVKGIMVEERTDSYVLRSKTGWASVGNVGWYVGYLERTGHPYFFALIMDMQRPEQAASRKSIARAIFHDLGLL